MKKIFFIIVAVFLVLGFTMPLFADESRDFYVGVGAEVGGGKDLAIIKFAPEPFISFVGKVGYSFAEIVDPVVTFSDSEGFSDSFMLHDSMVGEASGFFAAGEIQFNFIREEYGNVFVYGTLGKGWYNASLKTTDIWEPQLMAEADNDFEGIDYSRGIDLHASAWQVACGVGGEYRFKEFDRIGVFAKIGPVWNFYDPFTAKFSESSEFWGEEYWMKISMDPNLKTLDVEAVAGVNIYLF